MCSDFDDDFEQIEDETETVPDPPPKKVDPPPKPTDLAPPKEEPKKIDDDVNRKAMTVKSINQLKADLGPLTEEAKVQVEEAMNELLSITKMKRQIFIKLLIEQVSLIYGRDARMSLMFIK